MTPATSPLPSNWALVLRQIQTTLTQAIHLAETREAALEAGLDGHPLAGSPLLPPNLLATRLEALGPALPNEVNAFVEALGGMDGDALVHDKL